MNIPEAAIITGGASDRYITKPVVDMLEKSGVRYQDQVEMVRSKKLPAE